MSFEQNPELSSPISVVIPAGTTQTISFPQQFFGFGTAVIISNNDVLVATYQINGETQPVLSLAGGAFRTLNGVGLSLITVTAGAGGSVQIQAIRKPLAN